MTPKFGTATWKSLKLLPMLARVRGNPGAERYRRAGLSASMSLISQALAILISVISVPLTVHYLGAERYGVWLTISSLVIWTVMTDFGLAGMALVNGVAEAHGREDRKLARQYVSSAFWGLTSIAAIAGVIAAGLFPMIPWRSVFRVSNAVSMDELTLTCGLTLGFFVIGLPLTMLNSIYQGYQDGYVANLWTIAGNASALIALIVVTTLHGNLAYLVLGLSGVRVALGFLNASYLFFWRYPWLKPTWSAVSWNCLRRLFKLGTRYTVAQVANLGINQSQPIIITQFLGPSYVVIWVVAQRLVTLPQALVYLATEPLVSAYGEARARGDWRWIRETLKGSVIGSVAFGLLATLMMVFGARPLIRLWAGPAAVPSEALVIWLSLYSLMSVAICPIGQMLAGLERVGTLAMAGVLCGASAVGLSMLLASRFGLNGIAAGMCVSVLLSYAGFYAYQLRRTSREFFEYADEKIPDEIVA